MDKKYQIFVSSTYEDLKEEREQVIKAILEMGHIPVGMEMFSAADEEQWKIIKRLILESDYYVVVVANKYGSIGPNGVSYTEMEYDFSIENKIPTLGFILADKAPWPSEKGESTSKSRKSLNEFKSKIKNKLVNFWSNKDDLHAKVLAALVKTMTANPRIGWVKSSETIGPEIMLEISRLSSENSTLRRELEAIKLTNVEAVDEVRKVIFILNRNSYNFEIRKTGHWGKESKSSATLLDIFEAVAPNLQVENSLFEMARNIALHISNKTDYYKEWPIGRNLVTKYTADLAALDLIEPSKKKHSVHDKEQYWSLTKLGGQVLKRSRRIILEEGLNSDEKNI